jgi:hypothetical protein
VLIMIHREQQQHHHQQLQQHQEHQERPVLLTVPSVCAAALARAPAMAAVADCKHGCAVDCRVWAPSAGLTLRCCYHPPLCYSQHSGVINSAAATAVTVTVTAAAAVGGRQYCPCSTGRTFD